MTIVQCRHCGAYIERPIPYCEPCETMTVDEAAVRLKISRSTFYRSVKAGRIHLRKVSAARVLVRRAEVDMLLM